MLKPGILAAGVVAITTPCTEAMAQAYMDAGVYRLKDYVQSSHCDANGRNCDLSPAFNQVLTACNTLRSQQGDPVDQGCVIHVPEGTHRLTQTVNVCRNHAILGAGTVSSANQFASTRILADTTAFYLRGYAYCQSNQLGNGGNAVVQGMSIQATGTAQAVSSVGNFGIRVAAQATLRDLIIKGFTQGVRIYAAVPESNANAWQINNVMISDSRHAGLFVFGNDTNAGTAVGLNLDQNCQRASTWNSLAIAESAAQGDCAGKMEKSFLGNTFVGSHVSGSQDFQTLIWWRGYLFDGPTQESICIGCYAEGGQKKSKMSTYTMSLSAAGEWENLGSQPGLRMSGPGANKLSIVNFADVNNPIALTLGYGDYPESIMRIQPLTSALVPATTFYLVYNRSNKALEWQVDSTGAPWRLIGENGGPLGTKGKLFHLCSLMANMNCP